MKLIPFFRWYDLWIGAYYDKANKALYICPVPTLGIKLTFGCRHQWSGWFFDPQFLSILCRICTVCKKVERVGKELL